MVGRIPFSIKFSQLLWFFKQNSPYFLQFSNFLQKFFQIELKIKIWKE
jgi:hypothetical protein